MLSVPGKTPSFEIDGFQFIDRFLTEAMLEELQLLVDRGLKQAFTVSGTKGILRIPIISRLATLPEVRQIASSMLGSPSYCVRANMYNFSSPGAKALPWHQDQTIPLSGYAPSEGFGLATTVEGVALSLAPEDVLRRMVLVYVSLDGLSTESNALRFIPGTQQHSILDTREILGLVNYHSIVSVGIVRGGALAMSPLLLNSFRPVKSSTPCRLVGLTFASNELPEGLPWNERV